jgi:hypothetical protein
MRRLAVLLALGALAGCGSDSTSTGSTGSTASPQASRSSLRAPYSPTIRPADFVAKVDNPYLPYIPGTRLRYEGVMKNGKRPQTDVVYVTHRTKKVMGVDCTVVRDTVSSRGKPVERTFDWYAQDRQGNVWYMGEETQELKNGVFGKMIDSGPAGKHGATPGIIMEGDPKPGDAYWQFHWPGHALDRATVLRTGVPITVPFRSYPNTLLTQEQSPLEPGIRDWKWSAPGVGYVEERAHTGSQEEIRLVSMTTR